MPRVTELCSLGAAGQESWFPPPVQGAFVRADLTAFCMPCRIGAHP